MGVERESEQLGLHGASALMARLPKVGDDKGTWGDILNDYLEQSHDADGTLKRNSVGAPQLKPSSVTAAAISDGAVSNAKIADGAVGTPQLADASVSRLKLTGVGGANGIASLGPDGRLPENQVPGRLGEAELSATIAADAQPRVFHQVVMDDPPTSLTKLGVVLRPAFSWDAALVEGPACMIVDPVTGLLSMLYTGYSSTSTSTGVGTIGIARSRDGGLTYPVADRGKYFEASGEDGAPDEFGVTGGVVWFDYDEQTEHIFYIGLDALGYEQGTKRLCHASRPIGGTTWTRHGAIISPTGGYGWRSLYVWKPNIVAWKDRYYLFVNASGIMSSGDTEHERVGVFQSTSLNGPWTEVVDGSGNSINPLFTDPTDGSKVFQGDPVVRRLTDGTWRMDYFRAKTSDPQAAWCRYATTTDELFPGGWVDRGITIAPSESYDARFAHKDYPYLYRGVAMHPYTSVAADYTKRIALAVEGNPWVMATAKSNESSRTITATTLTPVDATTFQIDPRDKPFLQVRIIVRANRGTAGTLTVEMVRMNGSGAARAAAGVVLSSGSGWQTAVGEWMTVTNSANTNPPTAPDYNYVSAMVDTGSATIAGVDYEYRWARV